ncbi:MAG: efflux RND transporter periplasmic adaptor subunit [Candidatus Eremiobacteraeota bacterium]|nr:efflux RND transporter periplasmic adaptor subunit [Candidatus Eremiobacteraeota bacterium]
MPKWAIAGLIAAGIALVVIIGVGSHRSNGDVAVTAITVRPVILITKLPENGVVDLPQTATIAAQTAGSVVSIEARGGERVRRGQLLMKLDDRAISAKLSADDASLAQAAAALRKAQQTAATAGDTSAQTVAQAQQTLLAAQAQLQSDVNGKREGQISGSISGVGSLGVSGRAQMVQLQQQVESADSNLRTAKETYDSDRQLFKINALARQQLDRDRALYEQAQATSVSVHQQYDLTAQQLRDNAGQLGSRIEADRHAVESAQAALAGAQVQSHQDKTVDVGSAEAGVASAQAQRQYDAQQLADTEVRAPFDGVIQTLGTAPSGSGTAAAALAVGDSVTAGQSLYTIAGAGAMVVKAQVDEQDIFGVKIGQHALVSGEDFPGYTLVGTVTAIAPVVVAQSQGGNAAKNVETTIALSKRYPFLRDGMSCDVDIITGKAVRALTVPQTAVLGDRNKRYVFVVRAGIARKTSVREGLRNDTDVAITSGLRSGDVVAVGDVKAIKDGVKVHATAASPAPAASAS